MEGAADELEDEDSDDVSHDEFDVTALERLCMKLHRGSVSKCNVPFDCEDQSFEYNDSFAFRMAASLMGNTSLTDLTLDVASDRLSELAIQALAKGIRESAIKCLTLLQRAIAYLPLVPSATLRWLYSDVIQTNTTIRELHISCQLGNTDARDLGMALRHNNHLEKLSLHLLFVTDLAALHVLSDSIRNSNISALELGFVSPEVCRFLLSQGVTEFPKLRSLKMENHLMQEEEDDDDDDEEDDDDDYNDVLMSIPADTPVERGLITSVSRLNRLILPRCNLDAQDMALISMAMQGNSNLTGLNLESNDIRDKGVQYLVESWKNYESLQLNHLNLKMNHIGANGLYRLLNALPTYPSISSLSLSHNSKIGRDLERHSRAGNKEPRPVWNVRTAFFRLGGLNLSNCNLKVLPKGLLYNSSIEHLILNDNGMGNMGAASLAECFDNGTTLKYIDLILNTMGPTGVKLLMQASSAHACVQELNFSLTGPMGYEHLTIIANDVLTHSKLSSLGLPSFVNFDGDPKIQAAINAKKQVAFQALVDAVKNNLYLEELRQIDMPRKFEVQIRFYLELNNFGRRFAFQGDRLIALTMWPYILAKCRQDISMMFYFLQEQPTLIPGAAEEIHGRIIHSAAASSSRKR